MIWPSTSRSTFDRRCLAPGLFGPGAFLWIFPAGHYVLGPVNLSLWLVTRRRLSSTLPGPGPFGLFGGVCVVECRTIIVAWSLRCSWGGICVAK